MEQATKTCSGCGMEKPLEAFSRGKGYRAGRRSRCKACISKYTRESDAVRGRTRTVERYWTDHEWRVARCGRSRMDGLRRRGGLTDESADFIEVLLADPCAYCGRRTRQELKIVSDGAAIDHIDPDGDSHWTNLSATCCGCNGRKGRLPLLLALLEAQLRADLRPLAEQVFLIKGRTGARRRIDF